MKKFSKILALALAVAMMLGMSAMAATTLYHSEDYSAYADTLAFGTAMKANAAYGGNHSNDTSVVNYTVDLAAARAANVTLAMSWSGNFAGKNYLQKNADSFKINSKGNKYWDAGVATAEHHSNPAASNNYNYQKPTLSYIAPKSWNAITNTDETYVISFDVTKGAAATAYAFDLGGVIGSDGTANKFFSLFCSDVANAETGLSPAKIKTSLSGGMSNIAELANPGDAVRSAVGFTYDDEAGKMVFSATREGEEVISKANTAKDDTAMNTATTIDGLIWNSHAQRFGLGKVLMYTIGNNDALTATSAMNDATGVLPSTKKVTIALNQPVAAANVAVTANGVAVEGITTATRTVVSGETLSAELDVIFPADLALGTTYAIDLAGVTNELGTACVSDAITFETLEAPVATFAAYEGLVEGTTTITDYAGKTVYVKATVSNSNSVDFNGKVIIGIYGADGNLVKYASATKALAGNGTTSFGAAFKLAAGQTIRAEYR